MFTRSRKKFVAWIALFAVIFAALMPATSSIAQTLSAGGAVALGGICSTGAVLGDPAAPTGRVATTVHCAFCTVGAPLMPAHRVDALLAIVDAPVLVLPVHSNDALPRDVVAYHPLSPRAPPRAL